MRSRAALGLLAALLLAAPPAAARDRGADGRFQRRASSHFVLYQDVDIQQRSGFRGSLRFEQEVLAALEQAYDRLGTLLSLRPTRPITVMIYDPGVFDRQFAHIFRFPAAGFYGDSIHVRGDTVVSERLVQVLHHELVHAALDSLAPSLVIPAWFNEGLAQWFEARSRGKRALSGGEHRVLQAVSLDGGLFSLQQLSAPSFAALGPAAARLAYLQSYAFFDTLVRARGEAKLAELTRAYLRTRDLSRAFRSTYRTELSGLEQQLARELQ